MTKLWLEDEKGPGDQGRAKETWAQGTRQEGRTQCSFREEHLSTELSRAEPNNAEPNDGRLLFELADEDTRT